MNIRQLYIPVFPPPRRRVTPLSALPLAVFAAVFGVAWAILEWRSIISFTAPLAFLLLLVAAPWIWWMQLRGYSGLSGWRAHVALMTRLCVLGVFVAVLAEPRAVRKNQTLSVVYALDLSDSIGEQAADDALKYITTTASQKPEKDEAGLIVFGDTSAVELPPRITFPFEAINSRIARDGTNVEKALSLATAMLPDHNQGRVVLISDGVATTGNTLRELDELKSRGIAVDVLPVQYDYKDEVWLEKLDLPKFVKAGETYEAAIVLASLRPGSGKLVLRENGQTIAEQNVEFVAGKNRYVLPLYLREPGYYEYVAAIELPKGKDGWQENNLAINYLYLKGEGKVLIATDPGGDPRDYEQLVKALRGARREVELVQSFEFPRDGLSLMPYDCIVLPNVPADAFDVVQMQAIRDAVYNQGSGLLMVGGKNSFGPGGYHRTTIEEALPVSMDISQKKVMPKGALVIVLHTCEFAEGNTWGKRIAKEAIRVLSNDDEAGLLIYGGGGDQWVFPLTPLREYDKLVALINNCQPSDMPSFDHIMQMGLAGLKKSDAAMKHMIMISDGDPSPPTPALVKDFQDNKVSVSIVVINPHGGVDIPLLQAVAESTGGRYYFPQDPKQLPSIFVKEAKTLKRSMIQNKVFTPTIEFSSPILKGIDAVPELRAYVLTSPKPRSTTILKGPEKEEIDPVLSTWRFGIGSAAAFTSDLSTNWGAAWVQWEHYQAFVKQLMQEISRVDKPSHLHMQAFAAGSEGVVLVEDFGPSDSFLDIEAQVNGPRDQSATVPLKQVGPRRYQGQFPLWGKGRYSVLALGAGGGRKEQAVSGFAVPYSPEYLRFRADPIALQQIAEKTGGRLLTGKETGKEIFGLKRVPKQSSRSIVDLLLVVLAILIPLDVGVRRIQLDWLVIRGWLGLGRKAESTETLGALLRRKKEIVFEKTPKDERPLVMPPTATRPTAAPKVEIAPPPLEKEASEPENLSTTERLLRAKQKRKDGQK